MDGFARARVHKWQAGRYSTGVLREQGHILWSARRAQIYTVITRLHGEMHLVISNAISLNECGLKPLVRDRPRQTRGVVCAWLVVYVLRPRFMFRLAQVIALF